MSAHSHSPVVSHRFNWWPAVITIMAVAVILAVVSCVNNKAVPPDVAIFGEVGLSGEIRSVSQPLARLKEAYSLGFKRAGLPRGSVKRGDRADLPDIELLEARHIKEASHLIF